MESAGKARNNGLYRHIRTSKEIIRNLLNDYENCLISFSKVFLIMTAVKKFNISHISQHLKLLTNFCPNIVIIGMQSG